MSYDYTIELSNCRNIKTSCILPIRESALNVFFAKNGTGKTTISRAIRHVHEPTDDTLENLESFDYIETNDSRLTPSVSCSRPIRQLDIFDESWIDDHCFKESSVQEGAYELYIRNDKFRRYEKRRDQLLSALKAELSSEEIDTLQKDIATIVKGIGKAASGAIGKATQPYKAFKSGVPIETLPKFLRPVTRGMNISEQATWLEWHMSCPEAHAKDRCPYCGTKNSGVVSKCHAYDNERDSKGVTSWSRLANLFSEHHDIFAYPVAARANKILLSQNKPSTDDLLFLCEVSADAASVDAAIESMRKALSNDEFLVAADLIAELKKSVSTIANCKIFRKTLHGSTSPQAKAIGGLITRVKQLGRRQAALGQLTHELQNEAAKNVRGREGEINGFLQRCGYRYHVEITTSIASHNANVLLVADTATGKSYTIKDTCRALSYGERNAFSLALFALQVTNNPSGIVILDDPISSFDIDKRFGILYMLFSNNSKVFSKNLLEKNRTVLLLTHDYLVVSEVAKITRRQFPKKHKQMWYLDCDALGSLSKTEITEDSFAPYVNMLKERISKSSNKDLAIQLVYIRSLCEMLRVSPTDRRTRWGVSFGLISEIIHGRNEQEILARHKWANRSAASRQVNMCERLVSELTGINFDYWDTVTKYQNLSQFSSIYKTVSSSYEKLQVVRMMLERNPGLNAQGKVMERFADESCHIGGDYLYQLDPVDFNQVPFYVLDWCDSIAARANVPPQAFTPSSPQAVRQQPGIATHHLS
uniref:AAA family ATPase n=1 Tax=Olsenella uli TaxID=133926 RepID=UPI0028E67C4E|nr:AAA family ATPase [Olsenella uli]